MLGSGIYNVYKITVSHNSGNKVRLAEPQYGLISRNTNYYLMIASLCVDRVT